MRYIYLAQPLSKGNSFHNVHKGIKAADKLMRLGYVVFNPGLSALHDIVVPDFPYEGYMSQDFSWIEKCDCLIRLEGESSGADREVEYARDRDMKVFFGVQAFLDYVEQFAEAEIKKLNTPIKQEDSFSDT